MLRRGYGFIEASYMWMGWSLARDGDLFLPDNNIEQDHLTSQGHSLQIHTTGRAMFALPFLWVGHGCWNLSGALTGLDLERQLPGDAWLAPGDVRWVVVFMNLSGLVAMLATLVIVFALCRRYFSIPVVLTSMGSVFLGTFFLVAFRFWQGSGTPAAVLFTSIAVWIFSRMGTAEKDRLLYWWGLGVFIGLAFFVRYQALVFSFLPLVLWIRGLRRRPPARSLIAGALTIAGFTVAAGSVLVVSKLWWGQWIREPQAVLDSKEYLSEIVGLALHSPWLLYRTPAATLAFIGLLLPGPVPRRLRFSLAAVILLNLSFIAVRTNFLERTFFLGSRNFVIFFPAYCLGAAGLCSLPRCRWGRVGIGLLLLAAAAVTLTAFPFWGFPGGVTPSERFPRPPFEELAQAWHSLPGVRGLPVKLAAFFWRSLLPPEMLVPVLAVAGVFAAVALFVFGRLRRRGIKTTQLLIWAGTGFAVMSLVVTAIAYGRSVARVRMLAAEGYYDRRWPCLECEWRNARDDLQQRAQLYLFNGNYSTAVRLYVDSLALAPLNTIATPGIHEDIVEARSRLGNVPDPIDEFIRKYGKKRFPLALSGVKAEDRRLLFDSDPNTRSRLDPPPGGVPELILSLGDADPQFSDVVLVFRNSEKAAGARAWRSRDGIEWEPFIDEEQSYRFDRHGRALWIWGIYERPVHYIKVAFPDVSDPIEIEEILTVMSPRYAFRKIPGARDLPLSEPWKRLGEQ